MRLPEKSLTGRCIARASRQDGISVSRLTKERFQVRPSQTPATCRGPEARFPVILVASLTTAADQGGNHHACQVRIVFLSWVTIVAPSSRVVIEGTFTN